MVSLMQRRREMMMMSKEDIIDTSPVVTQYGGINTSGDFVSNANAYDVTDFYAKPEGERVTICTPLKYVAGTNSINKVAFYNENKERVTYNTFISSSYNDNSLRTITPTNSDAAGVVYFRVPLGRNCAEDSWAYVKETGDIIFAGKNTQYYGKRNINS